METGNGQSKYCTNSSNSRCQVSLCKSFLQKYSTFKLFSTDQDRMIKRWQVYWSYTVLQWFFGFNFFNVYFVKL